MWAQQFHPYSVCIQCEAHLQCSGCDRVCGPSLSNPLSKRAAFSKTQARKWDGSRKCKDCVRTFAPQAAAQAASQAAAQVVAQDTGAAQAATQDTGAVQEAEAPITGASQNAAQDTDATQGTAASQAAAQVVAQDTAAVQEADATEDVVSSTGAADDAARPPNRWQAMDFEDIQDLRRRRDLAALAADEEAALAAEEGAALAADEEAEHSTDAAFSEGDGSSDDESVTESQDDEFITVPIGNCEWCSESKGRVLYLDRTSGAVLCGHCWDNDYAEIANTQFDQYPRVSAIGYCEEYDSALSRSQQEGTQYRMKVRARCSVQLDPTEDWLAEFKAIYHDWSPIIQDLARRRELAARAAAAEEEALPIRNCSVGNQLLRDLWLHGEGYVREEAEHSTDAAFPEGAFEDSCVSDAQDSQERFLRVQAEVTKEEYEIWWDVQLCEPTYELDLCGCSREQMETWQKVEEHFMRVRGRGEMVQEH